MSELTCHRCGQANHQSNQDREACRTRFLATAWTEGARHRRSTGATDIARLRMDVDQKNRLLLRSVEDLNVSWASWTVDWYRPSENGLVEDDLHTAFIVLDAEERDLPKSRKTKADHFHNPDDKATTWLGYALNGTEVEGALMVWNDYNFWIEGLDDSTGQVPEDVRSDLMEEYLFQLVERTSTTNAVLLPIGSAALKAARKFADLSCEGANWYTVVPIPDPWEAVSEGVDSEEYRRLVHVELGLAD